MTPDPNGAHTLPINEVCPKCKNELAHPDEIRMKKCWNCSEEEEFYMGNEAYAKDHRGP